MAAAKWVVVEQKRCDLIGVDVTLQERRIYPADFLIDMVPYQVAACRCSADIICNMAGYPCKWAYTNPDLDPFRLL